MTAPKKLLQMPGLFSSGLYQRMRGLAISGAPFEMKGDLVKLWDNEKGRGGVGVGGQILTWVGVLRAGPGAR